MENAKENPVVAEAEKKPRRKKIKLILRWILLALCGAAVGLNIYSANAKKLVGNKLPTPFGFGASVVLSGSMEPEFSKGDLIVVREAEGYAVGDIVVFQDGATLVVHRIIAIDGESVTTKGDANNSADDPITLDAIKAKVLFDIPFVGRIVGAIKTPVGTVCLIAAALLLIELPRRREKQKDDDERQKLIDEINRLRQDIE